MNHNLHTHRAVIMRYVEAMNRGDIVALRTIFAEDAVVYGVLGTGGLDVAEPIWRDLHDCLAMELIVEEMVAEGDRVAVRYTETGTSRKPFRGKPTTGKSYRITAMEWFVIKEGRITVRWGVRDSASMFRQMEMP